MSCQSLLPIVDGAAPAPVLQPPPAASPGMELRRREFGTRFEFYAPGLKRWQTGEWQPVKAHRCGEPC